MSQPLAEGVEDAQNRQGQRQAYDSDQQDCFQEGLRPGGAAVGDESSAPSAPQPLAAIAEDDPWSHILPLPAVARVDPSLDPSPAGVPAVSQPSEAVNIPARENESQNLQPPLQPATFLEAMQQQYPLGLQPSQQQYVELRPVAYARQPSWALPVDHPLRDVSSRTRGSVASVRSQRSVYDVDGLPERQSSQQLPDLSVASGAQRDATHRSLPQSASVHGNGGSYHYAEPNLSARDGNSHHSRHYAQIAVNVLSPAPASANPDAADPLRIDAQHRSLQVLPAAAAAGGSLHRSNHGMQPVPAAPAAMSAAEATTTGIPVSPITGGLLNEVASLPLGSVVIVPVPPIQQRQRRHSQASTQQGDPLHTAHLDTGDAALGEESALAKGSVPSTAVAGHTLVLPAPPPPMLHARTLRAYVLAYFRKWRGGLDTIMPRDSVAEMAWSWLGAFISMAFVALLNQYVTPEVSTPLIVGSFGASAVLLFGVPTSKLAQPRNLMGGHIVSSLVGIVTRIIIRPADLLWLSSALGMSLALTAMQITQTVHPPGGASALIAASVPVLDAANWQGFRFMLTIIFGSLALLLVALVVNNFAPKRSYPTVWW